MSGRARTIAGTHFAAALMGCTILAGLPVAALAQDAGAEDAAPPVQPPAVTPTPAPAPSPASEPQGDIIQTIAVAGAQRLEPATIVSYVQLRPGDTYTAAAADQALKDLAATELFSDFSIENNGGNVVIRTSRCELGMAFVMIVRR